MYNWLGFVKHASVESNHWPGESYYRGCLLSHRHWDWDQLYVKHIVAWKRRITGQIQGSLRKEDDYISNQTVHYRDQLNNVVSSSFIITFRNDFV